MEWWRKEGGVFRIYEECHQVTPDGDLGGDEGVIEATSGGVEGCSRAPENLTQTSR